MTFRGVFYLVALWVNKRAHLWYFSQIGPKQLFVVNNAFRIAHWIAQYHRTQDIESSRAKSNKNKENKDAELQGHREQYHPFRNTGRLCRESLRNRTVAINIQVLGEATIGRSSKSKKSSFEDNVCVSTPEWLIEENKSQI